MPEERQSNKINKNKNLKNNPIPAPRPSGRRVVSNSESFVNPVGSGYVVTSNFDAPRDYSRINPDRIQRHEGIDFAPNSSNFDPSVNSAAAGTVGTVGYDERGYGNYVIINHRNGLSTLYAHLDRVTVRQGQSVSQGFNIGTVGNTGNSTGTHLHFSVIDRNRERGNYVLGGAVNPMNYLQGTRYRRQPSQPNQDTSGFISNPFSNSIPITPQQTPGIIGRPDSATLGVIAGEAIASRIGNPIVIDLASPIQEAWNNFQDGVSGVPLLGDLISDDPVRRNVGLASFFVIPVALIIIFVSIFAILNKKEPVKRVISISGGKSV